MYDMDKEQLIEWIDHQLDKMNEPYSDATRLKSPLYCAEMDGYKHALEDVLYYLRSSE